MDLLQAIIIAIVEGLTEYLPISSTAHMIFTRELMGLPEDDFFKIFSLCIQFGAILAVVTLYWRKFLDFSRWQFFLKLGCAVIPWTTILILSWALLCILPLCSLWEALYCSSLTAFSSTLRYFTRKRSLSKRPLS